MIRKATMQDEKQVYHYMCLLEQKKLNENHFSKAFQKGIADPDTFYFISENGFISLHRTYYLHHDGPTGEIVELIVEEDARNQKHGEELIQYVEKFAKEIGMIELNLCTSTYRKRAHHFYELQGYIMTHYNYAKQIKSRVQKTLLFINFYNLFSNPP